MVNAGQVGIVGLSACRSRAPWLRWFPPMIDCPWAFSWFERMGANAVISDDGRAAGWPEWWYVNSPDQRTNGNIDMDRPPGSDENEAPSLLFAGPLHGGRLIDNREPEDCWTTDSSECGLPVYRCAGPSHGRVAGPLRRGSSLFRARDSADHPIFQRKGFLGRNKMAS